MYFSRTFKALNFDFQIQGLSRTLKVRANPDSFFTQTYKGKAGCQIYVPKKQSTCEFTAIFPARKFDRQKMKKETITSQNTEIL